MKHRKVVIGLILSFLLTSVLAVLGPIPIYLKDDDTAQTQNEIITTGTRRSKRVVVESMVPIDILSSTDFATQSADAETVDILANLLPSFNVTRLPIGDGSTFVRPASLRGLSADQTLVLVNGKRRHRSALVQLHGGSFVYRGSQGVDLALIPSIAIKKVEVLRDGASAQYGSDAIAGVLNFILKDGSEGGTISTQYGQYSEGDGTNVKLGFNQGFALQDDRGFLNFSLEYKESDSTSRGKVRPDAKKLAAGVVAGCDDACQNAVPQLADRPYPAQTWGSPEVKSLLTFLNGELKLADSKLYFFANYANSNTNGSFYYRNPLTNSVFNDGNLIDDFNFNQWFPGGFVPRFFGETTDFSQVIGLKGGDEATLKWDVSASYGSNELAYTLENTVNPSLQAASPRTFKPGTLKQKDLNFNADFSKLIAPKSLPNPVHLAFGFEYRKEQYEIEAGDEASYKNGNPDPRPDNYKPQPVGSNGFPGFSPEQAGKSSQTNFALYADAETDLNKKLQLGVAARFEDFNTFGNTTDGKLAARYTLNDNFALRGSYSTGFRAPSPGQANTINVATKFEEDKDGVFQLQSTATIPADSEAAKLLGGNPLTPETSKNLNLGFTWQKSANTNLSVDVYNIKVKDRIAVGSDHKISELNKDDASQEDKDLHLKIAEALKTIGIDDAGIVRFFNNNFDTETKGIDIVFSTNTKLNGGQVDFVAAYNHNKTSIDQSSLKTVFKSYDQLALENQNPKNRLNLSARYSFDKYSLLGRANWHSKWIETESKEYNLDDPSKNPQHQTVGAEWTLDLEGSYKISKDSSIVIGGKNIFDNYPDGITVPSHISAGDAYPRNSPFGFNGRFWYARLNYIF